MQSFYLKFFNLINVNFLFKNNLNKINRKKKLYIICILIVKIQLI